MQTALSIAGIVSFVRRRFMKLILNIGTIFSDVAIAAERPVKCRLIRKI